MLLGQIDSQQFN